MARVKGTRKQLQEQIVRLDSECDSYLGNIRVFSEKGDTKLVIRYEKKFDIKSNEFEEFEAQLESINVEKIQRLKQKVEQKRTLFNS